VIRKKKLFAYEKLAEKLREKDPTTNMESEIKNKKLAKFIIK
jgi:hypothetical protein